MELRIAEAMRDPNALLRRMPHERRAVLSDNSFRLYHFEMRNWRRFEYREYRHSQEPTKAPGKNAASTNPRKNRVHKAPK
jgi:hypothetical protein